MPKRKVYLKSYGSKCKWIKYVYKKKKIAFRLAL